jgi:SAM-dependent methyltransferase
MSLTSMQLYPLLPRVLGEAERALLSGTPVEGWCPICGRLTRFMDATENLRESCFCEHCRSTNRQRQMAFVLLRVLEEMRPARLLSLGDVAALDGPVRIHNSESSGAVHDALRSNTGYTFSEYFGPEHASGALVNDVMHQDLTRCSFGDASLDVLMSSDVFEHIPEPYLAHAEVFRILKPGGRHVFTVPFLWDRWLDERRAEASPSGEIRHLLPPELHGDPVRPDAGILVFLKPSFEMCVRLARIGFEPRIYRPHLPWCGIVGQALVFDAVKPAQ